MISNCLLIRTCTLLQFEDGNVDSTTLFTYLKLEQHIPRDVFFSVELINAANMAGMYMYLCYCFISFANTSVTYMCVYG